MNVINVCGVFFYVRKLDIHLCWLLSYKLAGNGGTVVVESEMRDILQNLHQLTACFSRNGMPECERACNNTMVDLQAPAMDISTAWAKLHSLVNQIYQGLDKFKYLRVEVDYIDYINNERIFGDAVWDKFVSAREDIKEAGNCIASDCNTAAVFHLMRSAEWGMRALASHLRIRNIPASKKPGNKRHIPIAYAEWEKILDNLQCKVDQKISRLSRGANKQKTQEFYYPILQDIRAIRDAWRNHVMHTRATYERDDARAIMGHVGRLLKTMAPRISE